MKDSRIEWIGKIPEHWTEGYLKRFGYFISGTGFPHEYQGNMDGDYPFFKVDDTNLEENSIYMKKANNRISKKASIELKAKISPPDSIIFPKIGAALLKNKRRVLVEPSIFDNNIMSFVPRVGLAKFWFYYLLNIDFYRLVNPGPVPSLSDSELKSLIIVLPPLIEQKTIAKFLEKEIEKIDSQIKNNQKLIELLKEKRQVVINQAVTKGLDPTVPMKDSGVEWIGKIPKHWLVSKLKHYTTKIGSGITPKGGGEVYVDNGIPLIRSQNVHFDGLHLDDVVYITLEIHEEMKNTKLYPSDVLLNITGASIGRCTYVPPNFGEGNVNQHVCIIRTSNKIYHKFINFFISSSKIQTFINAIQVGASRQGLTFQDIGSFEIIIPPIEEQEEISHFIDKKTARLDNLISEIESQIQRLQEYRQAIISTAVTGKIDVRQEVVA